MNKPVLMDGAAGSRIWEICDEKGIEKVPTYRYNIEHPEVVLQMHREYVEAGSRMIQTNTFALNPLALEKEKYSCEQLIEAAVSIAKKACEGTEAKVYLSSGPLTKLLQPYGPVSEEECFSNYETICDTAVKAGVDFIVFETFMDLKMMKIALRAAKKHDVPVICSMTFFKKQRTMMGDRIEDIVRELSELKADGLGMNCSVGPKEAVGIIKEFRKHTDLPLYLKPNSGMDENYDAIEFASELKEAIPLVDYIGSCCGSNCHYIEEIKKLIDED